MESWRARRKADVQQAYDVQVRAGMEGAARYTSIGLGLAILGHYTWPFFRYVVQQTVSSVDYVLRCVFTDDRR